VIRQGRQKRSARRVGRSVGTRQQLRGGCKRMAVRLIGLCEIAVDVAQTWLLDPVLICKSSGGQTTMGVSSRQACHTSTQTPFLKSQRLDRPNTLGHRARWTLETGLVVSAISRQPQEGLPVVDRQAGLAASGASMIRCWPGICPRRTGYLPRYLNGFPSSKE